MPFMDRRAYAVGLCPLLACVPAPRTKCTVYARILHGYKGVGMFIAHRPEQMVFQRLLLCNGVPRLAASLAWSSYTGVDMVLAGLGYCLASYWLASSGGLLVYLSCCVVKPC